MVIRDIRVNSLACPRLITTYDWTKLTTATNPFASFCISILDGKMVMFGGHDDSYKNDVYIDLHQRQHNTITTSATKSDQQFHDHRATVNTTTLATNNSWWSAKRLRMDDDYSDSVELGEYRRTPWTN